MSIRDLPRLVRTVRHLRPSQVAWRARYVVERRLSRRWPAIGVSRVDAGGSTILSSCDFAGMPRVPPFHRPGVEGTEAIGRLSRGEFRFLSQTKPLGRDPTNWLVNDPSADRLWTITLHYHDWVDALASLAHDDADRLLDELLADWRRACDPSAIGTSNLVWNAFAASTRLTWWIRALLASYDAGRLAAVEPKGSGVPFRSPPNDLESTSRQRRPEKHSRPRQRVPSDEDGTERALSLGSWQRIVLDEIPRHAEFIARHVEWDLRANHVLRDAVGLAWAGRLVRNADGRRWLDQAARIAVRQAAEQVLADGGHFERSPMYHIHAMEDVASLALLLDDPAAAGAMRDAWKRMAGYLDWVRHPDGQIPLLNDGSLDAVSDPAHMLGIAPLIECLGRAATAEPADHVTPANSPDRNSSNVETDLPRGGRHFADTGLIVWHGDPWSVFFDVGPLGPDYQPGHGHADTLTVEASLGGRRLLVDPGCFAYDNDERRRYDRSTASHNTVSIDGEDSSETWHIFRVGRRAKPQDVECEFARDSFVAAASHDGYRRLAGRPIHRRRIEVRPDGALVVHDEITGDESHRGDRVLAGGWLFDPAWSVEADERPSDSGWRLSLDGRSVAVRVTIESESGGTERGREWFSFRRKAVSHGLRDGGEMKTTPDPVCDNVCAAAPFECAVEFVPVHPKYGVEMLAPRLSWRRVGPLPVRLTTTITPMMRPKR